MTEPRPRSESELVDYLRSIDVRAPDELHRRVETLVNAGSPGARRRLISARRAGAGRSRLALGLAGTLAMAAVAAVAIAVGLSGGAAPTLSLRQASAVTLSAATAPAPGESASNHAHLAAAVDGVAFPYWEDHFGWRSTGTRSDRVSGRAVTTVFYKDAAGRRLGYAIVAGTPAPRLNGNVLAVRDGVPYRLASENGVNVISWLRDGHLCVVSGRGLDSATLLALASWADSGSIAS
jgi:hypothetical protein